MDRSRFALLSKREREVVWCVVEGHGNRQIAEALGISEHTVKNYMFKIFDKLGVSNRVELVFHLLCPSKSFGHNEVLAAKSFEVVGKERKSRETRTHPAKLASARQRVEKLA